MPLPALEALEKLVRDFSFENVLDIGCGPGHHSKLFREAGKQVTGIDRYPGLTDAVQADYLHHSFDRPFDCLWVSHVLEHQLNVNQFLKKVHQDLREGGVLCVTVPPLKQGIVGGHLTLWNPGLLIYNLIMAGFDCRSAIVKAYGYNISLITPKITAPLPLNKLKFNREDIATLADFFPRVTGMQWQQGFDGNILDLNWDRPGIRFGSSKQSPRRGIGKFFSKNFWFNRPTSGRAA